MEDRPVVLLVDPQDQPRNFLRLYLESEGYRVVEAMNGRDALDKARRRPPAAVIAEMALAGMSGVDLFRALRTDADLREVPVIFVCGGCDERDGQYAEMMGVDAFLAKPVEPVEVLSLLTELLD